MIEPEIVINGVPLTHAQAMMVRCAIESLSFACHNTGNEIDQMYMQRIQEVRPIMYANNPHYKK